MTKCWLIFFFIAGLFADKAFADCLPAPGTPASIIEYFRKFNKPLPEQFCAKEAGPQASRECLHPRQIRTAMMVRVILLSTKGVVMRVAKGVVTRMTESMRGTTEPVIRMTKS